MKKLLSILCISMTVLLINCSKKHHHNDPNPSDPNDGNCNGPVPSNSFLYTTNSVAVLAIDTATNTITATIPTGSGTAQHGSFSPDNQFLYVATANVASPVDVAIIDINQSSSNFHQVIKTIEIDTTICGITVQDATVVYADPKGNFLYFLASNANIGIIDLRKHSCNRYEVIKIVKGINIAPQLPAAFTPNKKELWWVLDGGYGVPSAIGIINNDPYSHNFGKATILDLASGYNPQGISISPDNKAYISGWGVNQTAVFDVATRTQTTSITGGSGYAPRGNVLNKNATRLYTVTDGSTVLRISNTLTNSFVSDLVIDGTSNGVHFVYLSKGNRYAYITASNTNDIKVVQVLNDTPVLTATIPIGGLSIWADTPKN